MTDVRELFARLNPKNVRLDIGQGGGAPELADQDIAAAVGMIPAGLGKEVLINCWWEGANNDDRLRALIQRFVFDEFVARQREHIDAQGALVLAEICDRWARGQDDALRREVKRCKAELKAAKERCWPEDLPQMLPVFTEMVLTEITRERCEACEGRGRALDGALLKTCQACEGSGIAEASDRSRAKIMGCPWTTYRGKWRAPYLWLHDGLVEAERTAARQFLNAIGKCPN